MVPDGAKILYHAAESLHLVGQRRYDGPQSHAATESRADAAESDGDVDIIHVVIDPDRYGRALRRLP